MLRLLLRYRVVQAKALSALTIERLRICFEKLAGRSEVLFSRNGIYKVAMPPIGAIAESPKKAEFLSLLVTQRTSRFSACMIFMR